MISATLTRRPMPVPRLRMPVGTFGTTALVVSGAVLPWSGAACVVAGRIAVSPVNKGAFSGVRAWSPPV